MIHTVDSPPLYQFTESDQNPTKHTLDHSLEPFSTITKKKKPIRAPRSFRPTINSSLELNGLTKKPIQVRIRKSSEHTPSVSEEQRIPILKTHSNSQSQISASVRAYHQQRKEQNSSVPTLNLSKVLENGKRILNGEISIGSNNNYQDKYATRKQYQSLDLKNTPEPFHFNKNQTHKLKNFFKTKPLGEKKSIKNHQDFLNMLNFKKGINPVLRNRIDTIDSIDMGSPEHRTKTGIDELLVKSLGHSQLKQANSQQPSLQHSFINDEQIAKFGNNIYTMKVQYKKPTISSYKYDPVLYNRKMMPREQTKNFLPLLNHKYK